MFSAAAVIAGGAMCGPLALSAAAAPSAPAVPAGNPLARLTADQIALKAAADFKAASSFHYHGSTKDSGQTLAFSLSVTHHGCTGSISDGSHGSVVILAEGKTVWLQPNAKFWEYAGIPAAQLSLVQGKWMEVTGGGSNSLSATFAPLCSSSSLMSQFVPALTGLVKGKTVKISGHQALQLREASGGPGSFYVSISAKPEILRISGDGTLSFSAYGAPVTLTPPPSSDVIPVPNSANSLQHLLPGI
jgi:hypothetical protein